jgi:4-aminobutyrate aminotransferase
MRSHDILGNVQARSEQIFRGLRAIQADQDNGGWMIEEVRGQGVGAVRLPKDFADQCQLMVAMEFKDPSSRLTGTHHLGEQVQLPGNLNKLVQDACYDRGLLTLTTSIYPVLRMIPALTLNANEVDQMLMTVKEAVAEVASSIQ